MEPSATALTAFDVIVLLVVGFSFVYAVAKGFTSVVLSVVAWVGAVLVTLYAMPYAMAFFGRFVTPKTLADLIAVPALFITTLILFKIIGGFVGRWVREGPGGALDRALGGLLGLMLGVLLVSSLYLFLSSVIDEEDQPEWIQTARLRPLVSYGAEMVSEIGPELARTAEDNQDAQRMIERLKENRQALEGRIESGAGAAYEEAQRRLLEREVQRILDERSETGDTGEDDVADDDGGR